LEKKFVANFFGFSIKIFKILDEKIFVPKVSGFMEKTFDFFKKNPQGDTYKQQSYSNLQPQIATVTILMQGVQRSLN
jgi:hypothetical protein